MLGVALGDPAGQPVWELYALLLALVRWRSPDTPGGISVLGDASGILAAAVKRAARAPLVSPLVQELALVLASDFRTLEAIHIFSEDNTAADALSRLPLGAEVPAPLKRATNCSPPEPLWRILGCRP